MISATRFLPVAVIPVYNHEHAVAAVVQGIRGFGIDCILVDDGSGPGCAAELDRLAREVPGVRLVRRTQNGGKGAAVCSGLRDALAHGYTHALQIDADGQHALHDAAEFLDCAARHPESLVCGQPVFDASMPRARRYGRYLTHFWVWVNTLSLDIPDAMCGFRVYPLAPVLAVIDAARLGQRMDFDIEVLVRLHWAGVPMVWRPTQVTYPADGVSHFRMLGDNARITLAHTRLFFGMLLRLPRLLARRLARRASRRVSHA